MADRPEREVEGLQVDFGSPKRLAAWADTLDKDAIEHNTERPWPVVGHSTLSASSLPPDLRAAADALRTLQAELDRLEEAANYWRAEHEIAARNHMEDAQRVDKLEAENERLREALLEVDRLVTKDQKETPSGLVAAVTDVVDVALDALKPETEE